MTQHAFRIRSKLPHGTCKVNSSAPLWFTTLLPHTLCSSLTEPCAVLMNSSTTLFTLSFLFHKVNSSGPFRSHLRSSFVMKALSDPLCLKNDLGALYVDSTVPGVCPPHGFYSYTVTWWVIGGKWQLRQFLSTQYRTWHVTSTQWVAVEWINECTHTCTRWMTDPSVCTLSSFAIYWYFLHLLKTQSVKNSTLSLLFWTEKFSNLKLQVDVTFKWKWHFAKFYFLDGNSR